MARHETEMHRQRRYLRNLAWDIVEAWDRDPVDAAEIRASIEAMRQELWRQAPEREPDPGELFETERQLDFADRKDLGKESFADKVIREGNEIARRQR